VGQICLPRPSATASLSGKWQKQQHSKNFYKLRLVTLATHMGYFTAFLLGGGSISQNMQVMQTL
jgi:hypothetical protein